MFITNKGSSSVVDVGENTNLNTSNLNKIQYYDSSIFINIQKESIFEV